MKYFVYVLVFLFSCRSEDFKGDTKKSRSSVHTTENNVNKMASRSEKKIIHPTIQDTLKQFVSLQGWVITSNRKDNDLHIKWEKDNWKYTYVFKSVFLMRPSFIPQYIAESDSVLYFESACASGCQRISVISKYRPQVKELDYVFMVDYEKERFLNVNNFDPLVINQSDYKKRVYREYFLEGSCLVTYLPSCIKNVKSTQNLTELSMNSKIKGTAKTELLSIVW